VRSGLSRWFKVFPNCVSMICMSIYLDTEGEKELFARGVGEYIDPDGLFKKKLSQNPKDVVIKFGVDPTRPDIHLGHAVVFRKLRKFQDLGCKVVFLIGDLTAQIGDPSGRSKVRPETTQQDIEANMKTYLDQVGKILRTEPEVFSWIRNSDWYVGINDVITPEGVTVEGDIAGQSFKSPPLPANHFLAKAFVWEQSRMQKGQVKNYSLLNVLAVLRGVTYQRLIGRDMFQARVEAGEELYMHEMLYPVLQGIDSSVLASVYGACDLEVGGTDQTFNMLMGRDVMKMNKQTPQAVLAFELLVGTDGKEKMSKSLDNYIAITDLSAEMFGKVMSIPDSVIVHYFELCTYTPLADIEDIKKQISSGKENPRDIKMRLAREIVEIYYGRERALSAENSFIETFSKGGIPENIPEIKSQGEKLIDILLSEGLVSSKTEFRRLVDSKAIEIIETGDVVSDYDFLPKETVTVRIGKKRFLKIIF